MEIKHADAAPQLLEADALVKMCFEAERIALDDARTGELFDSGEFTGKSQEIAVLHGPAQLKAKRLVLSGAGKRDKFTSIVGRELAGAVLRDLKGRNLRSIAFDLEGLGGDDVTAAVVEGAILGGFETDRYQTGTKKDEKHVDEVTIAGGSESAVERGRVLGEAQNLARTLANEPGNLLPPLKLAEAAQTMAASYGLECDVLDQDRMRQLGMGALLGVSIGSAEPPALIVIHYRPDREPASKDHLGLVGKGVTFDTGGISIKPAEGMEKMKYDMAGGAAVIGAMQAIAQFKPQIPVTAFIPAVENMPGSKAQRPGDIVTSLSGKTVEVLNTDAEGRLILIDALTYAQRLGCTHLVDAATLTGAIVVALGNFRVGAFTNHDSFLQKFMAAANAEGERMWQLPTDEEYRELLKSPFADLQNIGTRAGGSITAAMFLKDFVGETPWIHLDIAGTAWLDEKKPHMAKGPTGICVRTFVELAMRW